MESKKGKKRNTLVRKDKLMSFDDVIKATTKPYLLLGNGFSISYSPERFSFTTLLESAVESEIISKESDVYKVFQKLATADFESVMRALENAAKIVDVYGADKVICKKIQKDGKDLKGYLVKIITNNHPAKSTELSDSEKEACLTFLSPFESIYTLNYDLLLYWATMHSTSRVSDDGFGNTEDSVHEGFVVYKNSSAYKMNTHYLHGALHYFDADDEIIKKTYVNTDVPIVTQTRKSLDEGKYPIFISEGTSSQKMTKILHSAYLNHCYKSLRNIGGKGKSDIVIFGASLKSNDEHIFDAILQSKVTNIYFGVSSLSGADHISTAIDEYNAKAIEEKQKKLHLYDYRTVKVWGR